MTGELKRDLAFLLADSLGTTVLATPEERAAYQARLDAEAAAVANARAVQDAAVQAEHAAEDQAKLDRMVEAIRWNKAMASWSVPQRTGIATAFLKWLAALNVSLVVDWDRWGESGGPLDMDRALELWLALADLDGEPLATAHQNMVAAQVEGTVADA